MPTHDESTVVESDSRARLPTHRRDCVTVVLPFFQADYQTVNNLFNASAASKS